MIFIVEKIICLQKTVFFCFEKSETTLYSCQLIHKLGKNKQCKYVTESVISQAQIWTANEIPIYSWGISVM